MSLFDEGNLVSIEHFIGSNIKQETFFNSWHGTSKELMVMIEPLKLNELIALAESLELYPYEYILKIRNVRIERAIIEGTVFTGDSKTIQMLRDKLEIPEAIRKSSINGELVAFSESGNVQVEGTFGNRTYLLEFIYNDLMAKESPGYDDLMDSLDSATIVTE